MIDILYAYVDSVIDDEISIIKWGVRNIGFGELIWNSRTGEILDDECMDKEFVREVLDFVYGDCDKNIIE